MSLDARQKARIDRYGLLPRHDKVVKVMRSIADNGCEQVPHLDYELANLMAEKLRHTQAQIQETIYPELVAANGGVLPIDSSPAPESESWRYFVIDYAGKCDWIDESGKMMPSSSLATREYTGGFARFGHQYDVTIFDLARAAQAGFPLLSWKGKISKRAHDAFKSWVWLFGDPAHELEGLCNHPNITHMLSPANGTGPSRLWSTKTDAQILADVQSIVQRVSNDTIRAQFVSKMYWPAALVHECKNRYIAATATATVTLFDQIVDMLSGDPITGQGKVEIRILNECEAALRIDPKTVTAAMGSAVGGTDTSGISGDFILACPPDDVSMNGFYSAYPMKQEAPKESDDSFQVITKTHERIGGAKLQTPKAFVMFRFA